jgi:hypothetical protein
VLWDLWICWGAELLYAVDCCYHRIDGKVKFLCERRKEVPKDFVSISRTLRREERQILNGEIFNRPLHG